MTKHTATLALLLSATAIYAQQQSQSTIAYKNDNRTESIEIQNVSYELVGRLVLRKTTHTKQVIDEIGMDATTTVEAWPLGVDLKEKPLYAVTASGVDPVTVNNEILVISRGVEEVQWWSVYKLANGQHLFDTYVPTLQFSTTRDVQTLRYAGLEVPPDDASDARLKAPNVVAVLSYASADRVIREALITADDPKTAQSLRSYADATRTLAFTAGAIRLTISQNYPSAPRTMTVSVPIARDDLDLARTQLPAGLHIAAWKR